MNRETCQNLPGEPAGALSEDQSRFLESLLVSATIAQAASKAGVSQRSGYRWLAENSAFKQAYRAAKRRSVEQTMVLLAAGAHAAVGVLLKIGADETAPASARVSAAGRVLDAVLKFTEMDDLAERIEALETRLGERLPLNGSEHVS